MTDKRNDPNWEKHKNQPPDQDKELRGSKEAAGNDPKNRLKDGTNDFQNGDQNETSEKRSDLENQPGQS